MDEKTLKFVSLKYCISLRIPVRLIRKVVVHPHRHRNKREVDIYLKEKFVYDSSLKGTLEPTDFYKAGFLTLKYLDEKLGKDFKKTKSYNKDYCVLQKRTLREMITWTYLYNPPNSVKFINED